MVVSRERLSREHVAATPLAGEPTQELVACGTALEHHEIAIVDDDGERQPDLREGEILLRGPSVTAGYYGDADATAAAFQDGWLHTGDLGILRRGELFVTGRKKDMLILHGRNYYPQDIEWCAQDVAGVRRGNAVAFSYADDRGKDIVVVVAEAKSAVAESSAIARQVRTAVRAQLGIVLADVAVIEKDSLPKTTSGKVRRAETRSRYLARSLRVLHCSRDAPTPLSGSARAS